MKLTLKDGKFYRGSEVVAPEFGNLEMINLLKAAEKRAELGELEGLFTTEEITTYSVSIKFTCSCGHQNIQDLDETFEDYTPGSDDLDGYYVECSKCGQDYLLAEHSDKSYVTGPDGKKSWNTKKVTLLVGA
jgi:ribosomal protein S27AE